MNEDRLTNLLNELKMAHEECWAAKIASYEIAKKHACLCVEIIRKIGYVPLLVNNRLDKRRKETDGMDYLSEDFWANEDIIIAFFEHFGTEEIEHGSA